MEGYHPKHEMVFVSVMYQTILALVDVGLGRLFCIMSGFLIRSLVF
jgi:hypothetical protein